MTELTGRELDHCVADIIGRRDCVMAELTKPGSPTHARAVDAATPHYSTDPATQAEKLAWLAHFAPYRGGYVEITMWGDGRFVAVIDGIAHGPVGEVKALSLMCEGASIDEALARLVVAVAKERSR